MNLHLGRTSAVVVIATALTSGMALAGWLDGLETAGLDALLVFVEPTPARHVVIVEIDDDDYRALFGNTSPLDTAVLGEIVRAVRRGRPAVVGVDVQTDPFAAGFADAGTNSGGAPIIWGIELEGLDRDTRRRVTAAPMGLPLFPVDSDGVIRRYARTIPEYQVGGSAAPSLPWALVETYCTDGRTGCEAVDRVDESAPLLLNLTGDKYSFPRLKARDVLTASSGEGWPDRGPLRDKIVVIGGTFRAARDLRTTPVGLLYGVELIARAVESELEGAGIRTANKAMMIGMEVASGFLIVAIHRFVSNPRRALWASLFGVPALALVSSFLCFFTLARWASFAPVLVGVLIHLLYEKSEHSGGAHAEADAAQEG